MRFENIKMKQALETLRKEENDLTIQNAIDQLLETQLLAPAWWDKDPIQNEQGQTVFEPNTKFQLRLIEAGDGKMYFPMFTSLEELEKWKLEEEVQSLVMSFDQYIPFVEMSKESVEGIVINPFSENVPFLTNRLLSLKKEFMEKSSKERMIQNDESFQMRNPVSKVDRLIQELCSIGKEYPNIQKLYLQERLVKNKPSHWFVIVDMDPEEIQHFETITNRCKPYAKGKAFEFIFSSAPIAQTLIQDLQPIYQK